MDFAYARLLALPKDWQVEGREYEYQHLLIYCPGRELFCVSFYYSSSSCSSAVEFEAFPRDLPLAFYYSFYFSPFSSPPAPSLLWNM